MAEDKEREEGQEERPSRPSTAAARRERRGTARPSARKDADAKAGKKARPAGKPDSDATDRKGKPTPTRDGKDAKPSFFARIARFIREVIAELRKVIWPTRKQMITYTSVVLVFVAFMIAFISGLDLGLGKAVFALFG
ncbi:MAG: preprotein translocase subunit SecE [Actinomycetota bacterium]|nr:preprotein translocase subunit SecE [Actinomycetota bacterium]